MNNENKNLIEKLEAKFDELFSDLNDELFDSIDESETIILNDENGNELEFDFIDLISYEGEEYVILLQTEAIDLAEDELVVLKLEKTDSETEESYVSVDDEDTFTAVLNIFRNRFIDEFNSID